MKETYHISLSLLSYSPLSVCYMHMSNLSWKDQQFISCECSYPSEIEILLCKLLLLSNKRTYSKLIYTCMPPFVVIGCGYLGLSWSNEILGGCTLFFITFFLISGMSSILLLFDDGCMLMQRDNGSQDCILCG